MAALFAVANVFTFSRSGWVALLTGLVLLGYAWLGRRRGTYVLAALVLAFGIGLGVLTLARGTPIRRATLAHPWGINKITGGRYYLANGGLLMFAAHPEGVGLGGFPHAYPFYRDIHARKSLRESHTTPITVLAELGVEGVVAYVAVLVAFFAVAFRPRRRRNGTASGLAHAPPADRSLRLVNAGLAAVVLAVIVDSLLYNAFFEDPYLWTMMALTAAAAYRLTAWRDESTRMAAADRAV